MKRASLLLTILCTLAACSPSPPPSTVPTLDPSLFPPTATFAPTDGALSSLGLTGRLIYTRGLDGLWELDMASGDVRQLWQPPQGASLEGVGASPDGTQLAVAYFQGEGPVVRTDLFLTNGDGTDPRPLLVHTGIFESYLYPQWSPDGEWIYYTHADVLTDETGSTGQVILNIERVRPEGGESEPVLENAEQPRLSSDGARMVHLRFDQDTYKRSLWISNLDGSDGIELISETAFDFMMGAQLSPDGKTVALAASGPYRAQESPRTTVWDDWFGVTVAEAHGLPWDIWTVPAQAGQAVKLTDWYVDSPWPAWSPTGDQLVVLQPGGVVLYEDEGPRFLAEAYGHGEVIWLP